MDHLSKMQSQLTDIEFSHNLQFSSYIFWKKSNRIIKFSDNMRFSDSLCWNPKYH